MMKKFTYILIALLITGCATEKRCLIKFPPDTVQHTEFFFNTEYRDTTLYDTIPGETVVSVAEWSWDDDAVWGSTEGDTYAREWIESEPFTEASTELCHAVASVNRKGLGLVLTQQDSILAFKVDSAIAIYKDSIVHYQNLIREVPAEIPRKFYVYRVLAYVGFGLLILFVVLALLFLKMK